MAKKILIVEDDHPLRNAIKDKLSKEDFEILEAKNGTDGLATALEQQPDLILLDIIMPKMDGMTMLKKLRADDKGKNIPVIILTNLSDDKEVAESTEGGAYDYLIKSDWKIEDVVAKVKEKLE